jgi:TolB-like protein
MAVETVTKFLLILLVGASAGCATLFKGFGQDVSFTSNPPGAEIYVDGVSAGKAPITKKISHGKDKQVEARLDGYLPKQSTVTASFSGYSLCLLWFSLLGDWITGSIFTVDNNSLHFRLDPIPSLTSGTPPPPPPPPPPVRAKTKLLAVLEFKGKNLDNDLLDAFTDEVRGGAVNGLLGHGVEVFSRESTMVLLKNMGSLDCAEGDCEVETARNIGADFAVTGTVVLIEGTYAVTLKLHDVGKASLVGTESVEAASKIELKRALREAGRKIVTRLFITIPARR